MQKMGADHLPPAREISGYGIPLQSSLLRRNATCPFTWIPVDGIRREVDVVFPRILMTASMAVSEFPPHRKKIVIG